MGLWEEEENAPSNSDWLTVMPTLEEDEEEEEEVAVVSLFFSLSICRRVGTAALAKVRLALLALARRTLSPVAR